jgi:hypothetical protein
MAPDGGRDLIIRPLVLAAHRIPLQKEPFKRSDHAPNASQIDSLSSLLVTNRTSDEHATTGDMRPLKAILRLRIYSDALHKGIGATERIACSSAIKRAIGCRRAPLMSRYDPAAWSGQPDAQACAAKKGGRNCRGHHQSCDDRQQFDSAHYLQTSPPASLDQGL